MNFTFIITLIVAFVLAIIIFKLLSKTFKLLVFLLIFAVIFGIIYFGYDAFKGKIDNLGSNIIPQTKSTSTTSQVCVADSDCAFVTSVSDCNLVPDSCNNVRDSSKFFKPGTSVKCSIDSVVLSPDIKCTCKKTSSGSYCEKL